MTRKLDARRGAGSPGAVAWAVLALGIVTSLLLYRASRDRADAREEARFQQAVDRVQAALKTRTDGFEDILRSAAALFVSSEDVTEAEFRRYWDELEFENRKPSVVSLTFLARVEDRYLVRYREGRQASEEGVGFDAGTVPAFRAALDGARDSDAVRFAPVSPRERAPGPAFAIAYPVFRSLSPTVSPEERRLHIFGWISMVVAVDPLMSDVVVGEAPGLAISLRDGADAGPSGLLYASRGPEAEPGARGVTRSITLGGHPFTLAFAARPDFADVPSRRIPPALLVFGLLVSFLVFGIVWSLSVTKGRAEALAETMTASLRSSEQRYEHLFEQSLAGIFRTSPDGRVLECNEAFARLFGYGSRQELLDQSAFSLYASPGDRERFVAALRVSGVLMAHESRSRRRDGTPFWTMEHATLLPGPPEIIEGTIVDITVSKEAEQTLRQSRERYRSVIETSRDGLLIFDLATRRILETNPALQAMLGYTAEELSIRTFYDIGPDDRASVDRNIHRLAEEKRLTLEDRKYRGKGGQEVAVAVDLVLIEENERQIVFSIVHNLSETRHLEDQLRQAQKMEAVGRLAGGVAHDFNNLLTAILGYAELLLDSDPSDDVRTSAGEIRKAGERAATLTKQLLAFSRKQVLQPRILDLNDVVKDTEGILRRLLGEDVALQVERDPHLWRVQADPDQIQQVLLNLAVNSRDAMPDGGVLGIATANVTLTSAEVPEVPNVTRGDYVLIQVSDSGHGMDREVLSHAFEPFYTTKERGKGTGLGLSTVYGIVKQSGGFVHIDSAPGKGTRVFIYLARAHGPADSPSNVSPRSIPRGGTETILLVEDEEAVRRLANLVLERSGYRMLVAGSAEEAVALSRGYEGEINLLLTDVVLPGMNGRRLADLLSIERPRMLVVFASGYFDDRGVLEPGSEFIQKPFSPDTLGRIVRRVLDRRPRPPA